MDPSAAVSSSPSSNRIYAGFLTRFFAALVDGILLGIVGFVIGVVVQGVGLAAAGNDRTGSVVMIFSTLGTIINLGVSFAYYIYFIGKSGQTIGKRALGIKVMVKDSDVPVGYLNAFLREVVGKLVSGLVLGLGYFWVIWDKDKQGWHDKIAKTVVVKV